MDYFGDIGDRIERRWAAAGRDAEALPAIAREALSDTPPPGQLAREVVAELLHGRDRLPRQFAPVGAFGQPGVTCHFGEGFIIDLYFWNTAVPAVHNHPFCGCFTVLQGRSLHNVYRFDVHETIEDVVRIGEMHAQPAEWLGPGDIVEFSSTAFPLIHSLVHVDNPSVSLVIRTQRTLDYYRYLAPHIALPMAPSDEHLARQLAMFNWLRGSGAPDYAEQLQKFLRSASFENAVRTLSALYDPEVNPMMRSTVRRRHGERAELILPSIETSMRLEMNNSYREQFTGQARILLSILTCAQDRDNATRLLAERLPGVEPGDLLRRLDVSESDRQAITAAWDAL